MNDQLKKYIDNNRNEFDDLEPSAAIFLNIKKEIKTEHVEEKSTVFKLAFNEKWLVAAAVLIVIFTGYLILNNSKHITSDKNQIVNHKKTLSDKKEKIELKSSYIAVNENFKKKIISKNKIENNAIKAKSTTDIATVYKDLTDSTSSSTRLAAILKIQNSGLINYDIIDRLAKTLEADGNSNVRLAALNLMGKYSEDSYVKNTFLKALNTQNDPIAQLGLIEFLSKTDNPKLDDKLYALANDPNTFAAVKDQAYLVLLNQNKL